MLNYLVSDRRPMLGLLTIAPVGGVVILLYAFMVLTGIEFGPVTATLAAVVIGVGGNEQVGELPTPRADARAVADLLAQSCGFRPVVLLTDGEDTTSRTDWKVAERFAHTMRIPIFPIGLGTGRFAGKGVLKTLARETGGRTFFISRAAELVTVYREIEEELRSQYLVAYSSDRTVQDGQFRQVEVKVRGGKLKARTISGYYP